MFGVFEISKEAASNDHESKANHMIKREINELFGLFPPKDSLDAKYIMVSFELCRIHQRQSDFRNAYMTMQKLIKRYPSNPYIQSRMGRLCLEAGRK